MTPAPSVCKRLCFFLIFISYKFSHSWSSVPGQTAVSYRDIKWKLVLNYCLFQKASLLELVLMIAYISCSSKQERVDQGIETEGSNLSGVSAKCVWDDLSRPPEDEEDSRSICIGSQPRRLSDKGVEPGVLRPLAYTAARVSCCRLCTVV